jgi:hypothetical protein
MSLPLPVLLADFFDAAQAPIEGLQKDLFDRATISERYT